jgi:hypothetical protein
MKMPRCSSWVRLGGAMLAGAILLCLNGYAGPETQVQRPRNLPAKTSPQARALIKDLFGNKANAFKSAIVALNATNAPRQEVIGLLIQFAGQRQDYGRRAEDVLTRLGSCVVEPVIRDLMTIPENSDADWIILARQRGGWDFPSTAGHNDPAYFSAMRAVHLIRVLRAIGLDAVEPLQKASANARAKHQDLVANWMDWALYGDGAPKIPGWPTQRI